MRYLRIVRLQVAAF